jgi:hypothetical protein
MIFASPFLQMGRDLGWIGGTAFCADRVLQPVFNGFWQTHLGAAARLSRSLMASPMPESGIGDTAILMALLSNSRSMANRLAAASCKSPG